MIRLLWPDGTYGLPQPNLGCPRGEGFDFVSGWRKHDTEDDKKQETVGFLQEKKLNFIAFSHNHPL